MTIAASQKAKRIFVELSHWTDSVTVRLRRMLSDMGEEYGLPVETHTASEWRQPLHFYSKRGSRDDYKNMALRYIEKNFLEHYRDDMPDDGADKVADYHPQCKALYAEKLQCGIYRLLMQTIWSLSVLIKEKR